MSARCLAPLFSSVLAAIGCSDGANASPAPEVPALPDEAPPYLDFWWRQGDTGVGQHLGIVQAEGDALELAVFDVPRSNHGWRQLFGPHPPASAVVTTRFTVNSAVFDQAKGTLASRVDQELGGIADFEMPVADDLTLSGQAEWDVRIVGATLVAFAADVSSEARQDLEYLLVFAHSAARAEEENERSEASYRDQLLDVFSNVGWVSTDLDRPPPADQASLISAIAETARAAALFTELGLIE